MRTLLFIRWSQWIVSSMDICEAAMNTLFKHLSAIRIFYSCVDNVTYIVNGQLQVSKTANT